MPCYPSDRYDMKRLYLVHMCAFGVSPLVVAAANPEEATLAVTDAGFYPVAFVEELNAVSYEAAFGPSPAILTTTDPE